MKNRRFWLRIESLLDDYYTLCIKYFYFLNNIFFFLSFNNYIFIKNNCYWIYFEHFKIIHLFNIFSKNSFFKLNFLNDLAVVDYPENNKRFKLVYILSSMVYNIKFLFAGFTAIFKKVSTIITIFISAKWLEREAWDMFGIDFNNNYNRRILTDYNFKGHPLRKDFPLSGFYELTYFEKFAAVIYTKIELMQELRFFILQNNWEDWNVTNV